MTEQEGLTIGEIGRVVQRIESMLLRLEDDVAEHKSDIAVLKSNRSTAIWLINGFYMIVIAWFEFHK